eukprot:403363144
MKLTKQNKDLLNQTQPFVGSHKTLTSSQTLNEIDVLKQVVNKHVKSMALNDNSDKKELTRDEFRNCYRVWSGFVKFIKSQVQNKHRMVDTKYIGWFYESEGKTIEYLPTKEYYEAGKFKNNNIPDFTQNFELVKQYAEKNNLSTMNEQAIALVCNTSAQQVQKILTNFFATLIEISRSTKQKVLLDFKIGYLHLKKNGELLFESKNEIELQKEKNKDHETVREDLSIIDTASAMLSQISRAGGPISIKSTYMENLSIKTPATMSIYSKSNYSMKSQQLNNNRSQSTKANSLRKYNALANSGINWHKYNSQDKLKRDSSQQPSNYTTVEAQSNQNSSTIPYPFLQAFIERRTGQRFSKRVKFNQSEDQTKILGQIINQISQNHENKLQNKLYKLESEQKEVQMQTERLKMDQQRFKSDKLRKRFDFLQANEAMLHEKRMLKDTLQQQKLNDRLNYFPFTHGDQIEQQRQMINDIQKQELTELFQNKSKTSSSQDRQLKLKVISNPEDFRQFQTPIKLPSQNGVTFARTLNHYPYKVKQTENMEQNMNQAWLRFEEQLRQQEDFKRKQAEHFQSAVEKDQKQIELEHYKKVQDQKNTKSFLHAQMEHKKMFQQFEHNYEKQEAKTSYGPEQTQQIVNVLDDLHRDKKDQTKKHLEETISLKKKHKEFLDKIEKENDKMAVEVLTKNYQEEQQEYLEIQKVKKQQNKNVWIDQQQMKQKIKNVENIFQ